MSVSSTKNLGLRGSKGKIIEFDIKDEIYVGGTFTNTEGSNFQYVDGFLTVDENGTYDSEFSSNPYGFTSNVRASIYKVLQQPDGKILVGGNFSGYINPNLQTVGVPTSNLIRLNSDATVDSTFLSWMNPSFGSFQGEIFDMALQSDGKLIVVGNFITGGQISRNRIVRLNSNSTIDTSFNVGTGFGTSINNPVRVVKILSDGKVLLGTNYTTYNGITVTRLLRLNSDASVDNTFNIGTGPTSTVTCIEFQSDGKMLVGGYFTSFNGVTTNRIIRLNTDGSRDTDFNIGTGFSGDVECIAIQNDGKILVGGNFTSFNGVTTNRIIRLNTDGSRDTSFNVGGFNNIVRTINLEVGGKILVGGYFTTVRSSSINSIVSLTYNGDIDTSFDVGLGISLFTNSNNSYGVYSISKLNNGKILIGGGVFASYKGSINRKLLKLNNKFEVDTEFRNNMVTHFNNSGTGTITDIKFYNDGRMLVASENLSQSILRFFKNGRRDGTFLQLTLGGGGGANSSGVNTIEIQNDEKILVGGEFITYGGITVNRILRLNSNGSIDTDFSSSIAFNNTVNDIEIDSNDKILVGGNFTTYQSGSMNYLIRLNTDGSKDTTFDIGTGFNSTVFNVAIQNDGKILVGGNFTSFNGVTTNRIIRLNSDGSRDTDFNIGTGFDGTVYSIYVQPDLKILVGGYFNRYNNILMQKIARLNYDGSIDNSFRLGELTNRVNGNGIHSINMTSDGKIIIGGEFFGFGGKSICNFGMLDSNGLISYEKFNVGYIFSSDGLSSYGVSVIAVKK